MTNFELLTVGLSLSALIVALATAWHERRTKRTEVRLRVNDLLNQAWMLWPQVERRDAEARERFRSLLDNAEHLAPEDRRLLRYLGYLDEMDGNVAGARERFAAVVRADRSYGQAWIDLARVAEDDEGKEDGFTRALDDADPEVRIRARRMLAAHHREAGRLAEAHRYAAESLELAPDRWDGHREMAEVLRAQEDLEGETTHRELAVRTASSTALSTVLTQLAFAYSRAGATERALAVLEHAIPTAPDHDPFPREMAAAVHADLVHAAEPGSAEEAEHASAALRFAEEVLRLTPKKLVPPSVILELADEMRSLLDDAGQGDGGRQGS